MKTLIVIIAIVGYGLTLLLLLAMNVLYSMYWKLRDTQDEVEKIDAEKARIIGVIREIIIASHVPCGWLSLLSAVGTTVLLIILAIIALIQSFG